MATRGVGSGQNIQTTTIVTNSAVGQTAAALPVEERPDAPIAQTTRERLPPMSTEGFAPPQGASQVAARGFDGNRVAQLFAFDKTAAPKSEGLIEVLRGVAQSPQAQQAVQALVGGIEQSLGFRIPAQLTQAAQHKPELLAGAMLMTAGQMKMGFDALHRTPARNLMKPADKTRQLPQTFDFADFQKTAIELPPQNGLKEIAPGLFRGSVRDMSVSDAQAKQRIVLAEVMDRLSDNANLPAGDRFAVKFNGGEYTRLSTFLDAMVDAGYEVEARVDHRVADFLDLKVATPEGIRSVAAPVMVDTGLKSDAGEPAIIPALHSEFVFSIKAGPDVKGEPIEGEIKWYQGVPFTGFFPSGLTEKGDWVGTKTTSRYEGAQALTAAKYAGLMADVINDAAKKSERSMAAYGDTGVCIDSVATVVRTLGDDVTAYPLLQGDELLLKELGQRIADGNRQDAPEYRHLADVVRALPSDAAGVPAATPGVLSLRDRVRLSMPWGKDRFPLLVAKQAFHIAGG